jgi:hypothetical protein
MLQTPSTDWISSLISLFVLLIPVSVLQILLTCFAYQEKQLDYILYQNKGFPLDGDGRGEGKVITATTITIDALLLLLPPFVVICLL